MSITSRVLGLLFQMALVGGCQPLSPKPIAPDNSPDIQGWPLAGGTGTVFTVASTAFSNKFPDISPDQQRLFFKGRNFFRDKWVPPGASTKTRDGLGPLFNATSCVSCHVHDGRGNLESPGRQMQGLIIRLSLPGEDSLSGLPKPHPHYGIQFQPHGVDSSSTPVKGEGNISITYDQLQGPYADGGSYVLRRPSLNFVDVTYGPIQGENTSTLTSMRLAPALIGLGLLEAIAEEEILTWEDIDDSNGDGISGKAAQAWDVSSQSLVLGRFGWKASQPSVAQQVSAAFHKDLGLTSPLFPEENCANKQTNCLESSSGGEPELQPFVLEAVVAYMQTLAVPGRRDWQNEDVRAGEKIFQTIGCIGCHRPSYITGNEHPIPQLREQKIHPYSDLLLHDMGKDLADDRPVFGANGREWRTPPLWGIGLAEKVNGQLFLLHDGRAQSFAEAILWHGGEANKAREKFRKLPSKNRQQLVKFLESL